MSLALLQSFVKEIKDNNDEMKKSTADIADIKEELKALKEFDVNEEKEEEKIREDINDLEASDALQVVIDVEAAVDIADLQAEILALKAKIELYKTVNNENEEIIKDDVNELQVDVEELQVNDKKEEEEKAMVLASEIAILEARLLELNMATHPVLY